MQSPSDINEQLALLKSHPRFADATMEPCKHRGDEGHLVIIPKLALPSGWNRPFAKVAFFVPSYFPSARPSGFWTLPNVWLDTGFRLEGGSCPQWTYSEEDPRTQCPGYAEGMRWLYEPSHWSAVSDTLLTYAHFVRQRFNLLR